MKKKNAFTLVELLAVIVILAIILVIAVPKILNVIADSTKSSFESSVVMIASSAEKDYQIKKINGGTQASACSDVAKIDSALATACTLTYDSAGNATVAISSVASGKFKGCSGTYASVSTSWTTAASCS